MGLLITFALVALGFSFLCSIMEAVFLSVTISYIIAQKKKGHRSASLLESYKLDTSRPLAAILSLNTIAHTVGAAGVGAQAAALFGSSSVVVASIILTLLMLYFTEIIPKTLGAHFWRQLAPAVAYGLALLIPVMFPFVFVSRVITTLLSGLRGQEASREELRAIVDLGERAGLFRDRESSILRNLFRFPTLQVKDIMTPRPVLFTLDGNRTVSEIVRDHPDIPFSRIPIYLKDVDSIIGYVLLGDLFTSHATGKEDGKLVSFRRDIISVPATLTLSSFFDSLLDSREHIALVIDEFGGTAGIATMEDVVETLLGMEIVDEADQTEDMQALARAQWEKRARHLGIVGKEKIGADSSGGLPGL
jgi:CBS domain containing-hemolysin-like protein